MAYEQAANVGHGRIGPIGEREGLDQPAGFHHADLIADLIHY
jgi:hypothetical protein